MGRGVEEEAIEEAEAEFGQGWRGSRRGREDEGPGLAWRKPVADLGGAAGDLGGGGGAGADCVEVFYGVDGGLLVRDGADGGRGGE